MNRATTLHRDAMPPRRRQPPPPPPFVPHDGPLDSLDDADLVFHAELDAHGLVLGNVGGRTTASLDSDDYDYLPDPLVPTEDTRTFLMGDYRIRYVRAPQGIPGIEQGAKLRVRREFLTGASCPLGAGLRALELEHGVLAVFDDRSSTRSERHPGGIAWFRDIPTLDAIAAADEAARLKTSRAVARADALRRQALSRAIQ